ncbi:hypothetical protein [Hansschlegelia sp. KR7-227]|jgi:hypothetical protein|uniref:hypothetical protein n=1 Tax=Hansschlegelia sp. KR7-227 TaxID=3400914 RepID=UPI003C05E625
MSIAVAPFRPFKITRAFVAVYALTILSCWLVNVFVTAYPIGPWRGGEISKSFWLDNVSWQIFAAWWACLFAVCGLWPFSGIRDRFVRGVVVTAVAWALGWLSAKLIIVVGPGASGIFPLVGTTWFFLALFCFAGANWLVAGMPPSRQFCLLLLLITGCTFLVTHSAVVWVPAWWFPFLLIGLSTGTLTYLTRGMSQPGRAFAIIAILFAIVAACVEVSILTGFWTPEASPISAFWSMGHFTPDNRWLVCFMVATSINYAMPIITYNWPFTKIAMPWGGLLACAFYLALDVVVASILLKMVGPVFPDTETLLTYAYMGVNWSLVLPLVFGVGFDEPYLWRGQKTQGGWDDVA